MGETRSHRLRLYSPYGVVVISWIAYAALATLAPAGSTPSVDYHLAYGVLNAIRISILVPILAIWLLAAYGAGTFLEYSRMLGDSAEGRGMNLMAKALYLTLWSFVVSALFGSMLNFYTHSVGYAGLVIIRDHLAMLMTLVAFVMFFRGSLWLGRVAHLAYAELTTVIVSAVMSVACVWYVIALTSIHIVPAAVAGSSLAYVRPGLLAATLVVPYFVAWYLAILATITVFRYARAVRGVIYRQSMRSLAVGVCAVVAFSTLTGVIMLMSGTLAFLHLGTVLGVLYVALILYAVSYLSVAAGARKLSRIERAV